MAQKKEEQKTLADVIAEINKSSGENTIGYLNDMKHLDIERIPSGSVWLDYALGGGWPVGRAVELFGSYSSGKSLISQKTIIEAQKLGKTCCYIDCESSFDPRFAQNLGIDLDKLILVQSSTGEKTIDMMISLLGVGVDLIVVDSVAALVPTSEMSSPTEQQTIGLHARMMSKALRKLTVVNKNSLIIFINQQREAVGTFSSYGVPLTTTGGRALGFYSSIRVEVKRGDDIEEDKRRIGQIIKFKVQKNKTSIPFRNGYIKFIYKNAYNNYQFDSMDEIVSLGIILGIIEQRGAYFYYEDGSYRGRNGLEDALRADKKLFEKIKSQVLSHDKEKHNDKKKATAKKTTTKEVV